ncbi:ABC transporter ATP-binding protein [Ruminococcus gauvreauii]|uniref:ABC transporter ATP-binding protein/permease n=1 Tax=Ruminococcus gauvreauii TaxID=438033 RepID=A0ABY5VEZ6_9FIRM|nr:ABC transporter ATP-binding protein [Ruminococcus gauvreauii]UWP58937.1 ABC transporter ATP-binding protein/permease [Ruminococcus gauvreauii]
MTSRETAKRVLRLIRPYGAWILLTLTLATVTVMTTLYAPVLIGNGVDYLIGKENVVFSGLTAIVVKLAVIVGVTALSQWLMGLVTNHITYEIVQSLRDNAFDHMQKLPLAYLDRNQPGDMISRISTDVDQFADGLLMGFTQLFTGIMTIVATFGFMLSINVKITFVVVVITPLSIFVANFIAKRTFAMFREQSEARGTLTSLVEEMVGNQKVVKAFSYEERAGERFDEINQHLNRCGVRATFFSSITNPSTRFINSLVYTGVGIFGALSAIKGNLSVGQLSCFLNYANQYTKPFNEISGVITELQNALASARRIFELLDESSEKPDAPDAAVLDPADGTVAFEHAAFSYRPDVPLITDLNLSVRPGQRIAIVGPTGCGKTTLINLLMRFYDIQSGEIRVSGYPIDKITRSSLRSNFGMVLQDTWLKSGTILENIAYGKPEATRDEVIAAAKRAHAHSFIKRMKDGYETYVTEEGGSISQGQKQLLCIARVMLMDPTMLILDEATSSIDTMTEIRIQKAFEELMKGRTSFIVAHRLSTIRTADMILVMKDGKIIETGDHETLLEKDGSYAKLYRSQFAVS